MLECKLCNRCFKVLGKHLRSSHKTTISEYQKIFPDAEVTSKETREKMRNSNKLTGKTIGTLEQRFGESKARDIKTKIGKNSGASRLGKSRQNQGVTLSKVWDRKREEWSQSIRLAYTTSRKQKLAETMRNIVSNKNRDNFKPSGFEDAVRTWLANNDFEFITQYRIFDVNFGTAFFDFYIPDFNLVIECDGEYWHKSAERINNDIRKCKILETKGMSILRISDMEFSRNFSNIDLIANLLTMSDEELMIRNWQLINTRSFQL